MASASRRIAQALAGHFAEDAHGEAGAGERLALNDLVRQPELRADLAHLVLEQLAQRLDELELHASSGGRRRCGGS